MKRSDIERVIRETYEARRDEDVDGVLAHFTKDATFRLSAGERFGPYSLTVSGYEDLRHHFGQLFSTWDFRRFRIGELVIDEGGSPVRAAAHLDGTLRHAYQIDPAHSWMVAAAERDLPIFVPGWEDSTMGNVFAARCVDGTIGDVSLVRGGIEYMIELAAWYTRTAAAHSIGFFQIGGGIAGDFPICVVPMLEQDLHEPSVPLWGYFCQISDSTTSYGSYSGAVPNEKITWGKLSASTPKFIIESDATIVAPLIFAYVLGE